MGWHGEWDRSQWTAAVDARATTDITAANFELRMGNAQLRAEIAELRYEKIMAERRDRRARAGAAHGRPRAW